ncbi:MAG: FAD binding domain-containing protein [Planctomycetota bacterium]|nr:FAD binding domain-containing protein [Planctomycetota bacterium]
MLRLPPFRYLSPRSLEEAVSMLADHGPEAMLVAGGTDVYPKMRRRQFEPKVLVGLARVGSLREVRGTPTEGVSIGAGVTLTQLTRQAEIVTGYSGVVEGAEVISTPQLRNMGTIGGNLLVDTRCTYYDQTYQWRKSIDFCMKKEGSTCWVAPGSPRCLAVTSTDLAPVMMSLGARLRFVGPEGERVLDAADLYREDGIHYHTRQPGEILAEILLPSAEGWSSTYRKLRRREAFDFPLLGVAVGLRTGAGGEIEDVRIAIGGVGSAPQLIEEATEILCGKQPSEELIEKVASMAFRSSKALDNTDLIPIYRKKMAPVFVRRALRGLLGLSP